MKISLAYKSVFIISIFIFAIAAIVAFYLYSETAKIVGDQIRAYLLSIAESMEGQVFLFFDRSKVRASDWSSDGFIRQTAEKIIKSGKLADIESLNNHLLKNKLPVDSAVKLVDVVGTDLRIIASSEPGRVGLVDDEHVGPLKERLLKANFGEVVLSELKEEKGEEEIKHFHPLGLMFHAIAPIKSLGTGETIGFLTLHFQGDILDDIFSGKWQIKQGAKTGQGFMNRQKTAEIYFVNKEKLMITPSRFVENAVLKQRVDTDPVRKCLEENEETVGEYIDYRGVKVNGASMCFSDYKFTLVVQIDSSEIFALLDKERRDFIFVVSFLWIISVFAIFLLIRLLLKNLKALSSVAEEVAKGNFDIRTNVKSKDEIGDLAIIFNQMLDNIERSRRELEQTKNQLKEINVVLEGAVKERTKELEELKNNLEKAVAERTAELKEKIAELEKFKDLTVGRELKMMELKKELEKIKKENNEQSQL